MPLVDFIEDGPDTLKILLTTDNHVGYLENDPIRGDDSWKTFDEITRLARDHDVDMIIQGGDLFHINKPTKKSMYHVMKSLRANCMGDRPCELELLSEPGETMSNGFDEVNYEDPNLNISVPVFAINGNHDDATGEGMLSALDVLAVSGLINYFGKTRDNNHDTYLVKPILLQKGSTKFALYGMSNVRDEKLHRLFRDGEVRFERPGLHTDEWFNFLAFHQNHAVHTFKSSIPENYLPHFLNFILWGHEHECIDHAVHNPETGFDVLQAGSSVATSLAEGEVADKKVFVMRVRGKDYTLEALPLETVRPFVLREIVLLKTDLVPGAASKGDVIAFLTSEVEKAIEIANVGYMHSQEAKKMSSNTLAASSESVSSLPPLPLIRLRVEYSGGFEIENVRRFSNQFVGRIANANDVVLFYKKRAPVESNELMQKTKFNADLMEERLNEKKTTELALQDIVSDFLKQTQLTLVPETGLNEAVRRFVENDDKNSLSHYINTEIKKETKVLLGVDIDNEEFHLGNGGGVDSNDKHSKNLLKQILMHTKKGNISNFSFPVLEDTSSSGTTKKLSTVKTSTTNRKKSKEVIDSDDSDVDVDVVEVHTLPSRSSSRRKTTKQTTYAEDEMEIISSEDEYYPEPREKSANTARGTRGNRGTKSHNGYSASTHSRLANRKK